MTTIKDLQFLACAPLAPYYIGMSNGVNLNAMSFKLRNLSEKDDHSGDHHKHDHDDHHGHDHSAHSHHHHGHSHFGGNTKNIGFAFILNLLLSLVEITGGIWIGSLAIIAGAIHDLGDSLSLGLAWYLEHIAKRRKNSQFNFGYRRFSLLSALITGILIIVGSAVVIVRSAQEFFSHHSTPDPKVMIGFAVLGIAVNAASALRMSIGQTKNEKILTWHLIEDFMSWFAVLLGAIILYFVNVPWLDAAMAVGLSIFVAYNVVKHLKSTVFLFLQARPEEFNEQLFIQKVRALDGIMEVSNIAIWSLDGVHNILSCRIIFSKNILLSELEKTNHQIRSFAGEQGHFDVTVEAHYAPDCACPED